MNLSITETWAGRWGEAAAHADAAVQLAHEIGLGAGGAETYVAYVAAHRGEPAPVLALADRPSEALHDVLHLRPLALLALSQGNIEQAYRYSLRSLDLLESASLREPAVFRIHADAIESAIAAGDVDGGEAVTLAITRHARRSSVVWNHVVAARARALVAAARGDLDTALTEIEAARLAHERLPVPFELARTLLVAGKLERRTRHRSAAKESIGRATVIFEQLGASLWAEQARAELARVGLHRGSGDGLTESESRVAELAAAGFTNREIAAKAFMSEKTVEYNLTRVYRKLEVRSRTELVAALASGPAAEPEV